MDKVLVYAKGSFRKVEEDTVYHLDETNRIEYFDDTSNPYSIAYKSEAKFTIGIGNNEVRKRIVGDVKHFLLYSYSLELMCPFR
ncbi:hypothetical protein [Myroides odoratimimus]|uniref:PglD-related sugar-binding protein n=1 Tax=Myroides odoratimimus TaxID=76832 RepID=UPI0025758FCF|nr:hypothetical protein [Myroides odoratimimus]